MKKLFFALSLLISFTSFGQEWQNNNWVFNNAPTYGGINFNGFPPTSFSFPTLTPVPTLPGNVPQYLEGCASLSDENGNLIMFSDGVRLWLKRWSDNTFRLITNKLMGHKDSTQNVIFIPRPSHPNHYYIVTIDGYTGDSKGLYYAEIDFSDNANPILGNNKVLKYNPNPLDISTQKSVDDSYHNISEAITSTMHSNGTDYWLIAHVQNGKGGHLLSYQVTCNGILGDITSIIQDLTTSFSPLFTNHIGHTLKISPNQQRFSFATGGALYLGTFDNSTGVLTPKEEISSKTYGTDFSNSSNIVFYSEEDGTIHARNFGTEDELIFGGDSSNSKKAIQLARDSRVYINDGNIKYFDDAADLSALGDLHSLFTIDSPSTGLCQWVRQQQFSSDLIAHEDVFSATACESFTSSPVYLNDTYNSNAITSLSGYTLSVVGNAIPGITLNPTTGIVTVAEGVASGTYTIRYVLCNTEKEGCPVCSNEGVITITVKGSGKEITPKFDIPKEVCSGTDYVLPTTSDNGITGWWSPTPTVNTSGTYNFNPYPGQCAAPVSVYITVIQSVTPTFAPFPTTICSGSVAPSLPTTSLNGIIGTWPPISNTVSGSYAFTPNQGQCANPVTIYITIIPRVTPVFNLITTICAGTTPVLPTTSVNGIPGTWIQSLTIPYTYTFNPNNGQCANPITVTFTIIPTPVFNGLSTTICAGSTPTFPSISSNGITGTWSGANPYTFTPNNGCAPVILTFTVIPNVTPIFNIPASICYGSTDQLTLDTTSLNGISGIWSANEIDNTASGPYTFYPVGQCAIPVTVSVTVLGESYHLNIMDQYVDGTQGGYNSVGLAVNGNYPSGTNYFWTITRQDGSVQTYSSSTVITYVVASISNRIVSASVIATYQNCSREYFDTWHCPVPHADEDGVVFPDCTGPGKMSQIKNNRITIYPNPTKSMLNFDGEDLSDYSIRVFDIMGKEMLNSKIERVLNIDNFPQGVYIYEISKANTIVQHGKIVKD